MQNLVSLMVLSVTRLIHDIDFCDLLSFTPGLKEMQFASTFCLFIIIFFSQAGWWSRVCSRYLFGWTSARRNAGLGFDSSLLIWGFSCWGKCLCCGLLRLPEVCPCTSSRLCPLLHIVPLVRFWRWHSKLNRPGSCRPPIHSPRFSQICFRFCQSDCL